MFPASRYGFNIFEASIVPSLLPPAPTRLCISSIYTMLLSASLVIPSITSLIRFSKSPRNWVPANRVPRSNWYILLPFRRLGTSQRLDAINSARPYTSAVLPTPGSPICRGLFFSLRQSTCIVRCNSSFLPIKGLWFWYVSLRHVTSLRQGSFSLLLLVASSSLSSRLIVS